MERLYGVVTRLAFAWIEYVQSRNVERNFKDFAVKEASFKNGEVSLVMEDCPAISVIAIEAAKLLTGTEGAENYVQMDVIPRCQILDPIRLTVGWAVGKPPSQLVRELKAENERLRQRLGEIPGPE